MLALSLTTQTPFQLTVLYCCGSLRGHDNDYMYSTSMINFEGCSLIFVMPKARKYLGMFTYPLATNSKFSKTKLFQLVHKGAQIECFKGKYGLKIL